MTSAGYKLCPLRLHDYNLEWKPAPHEEEVPADAPGWPTATNDGFAGLVAYGQTKTANMLMAVAMRDRFEKEPGIDSFCVDAGCMSPICDSFASMVSRRLTTLLPVIWTGIQVQTHKEFRDMLDRVSKDAWKSTDEGISPILAAAFDPSITGGQGWHKMFAPSELTGRCRIAYDSLRRELQAP